MWMVRRPLKCVSLSINSCRYISQTPKPSQLVKDITKSKLKFKKLYKICQHRRGDMDSVLDRFLGQYSLPDDEKLVIMSPCLNQYPRIQPRYESLRLLGRKMIAIQCQLYVMTAGSRNLAKVAGIDFDVIAGGKIPPLDSPNLLAQFTKETGIERAIIPHRSHECEKSKHSIDSLCMLIGSVYHHHGSSNISYFVRSRVIDGSDGLFQLSLCDSDL